MYACILIPRELSLVLTLHPNPMQVLEMSATVWSNTHLPPGTVFYPDEGEVRLDRLENRTLLREDDIRRVYGCYDTIMNINGQEVRHCNWVRFVKTTNDPEGANVISSKVRGQAFYQVTRPIKPNEEIVVLFHLTAERSLYDRMTSSPFPSLSPAIGSHMTYSDLHASLLLRHSNSDKAGMLTSTPVSMATPIRDSHPEGPLSSKRRSLTFGSSSSSSSFASPVVETPRNMKYKHRHIPQESSFSSPLSSFSSRETTGSDEPTGEITVDVSTAKGKNSSSKEGECYDHEHVFENITKSESVKIVDIDVEKHSSENEDRGDDLKIDEDEEMEEDDVVNLKREQALASGNQDASLHQEDVVAETETDEEGTKEEAESPVNCVSTKNDDENEKERSDNISNVSTGETDQTCNVSETDQSQTSAIVTSTISPEGHSKDQGQSQIQVTSVQSDQVAWPSAEDSVDDHLHESVDINVQGSVSRSGSFSQSASDSRISTLTTDGLTRPASRIERQNFSNIISTTFPGCCSPVDSVTIKPSAALEHQPIKRCRERTWWPCDVCGKRFDRPSLLKRHTRTHTGEKPHACDVCGKAFSTSSSLNTHRRIHSGEKPHQCKICGKRFTASSNLYYHRMTHNKEKPHKCDLCAKSFPTPGDLRSHMYIHNGSWPFRCEVCNRGFSKQTNLKNHMLLHSGDKPHECPQCGKKFALSCNLKTHLKTHENSDSSDSTDCQKCGRPLHHSEELRDSICKQCREGPRQGFSKPPSLSLPTQNHHKPPQQRHTDFSISKLTSSDKKKDDKDATKIEKPFTLVMPSVTSGKVRAARSSPPRFMTSSTLTSHQQVHPMYRQFITAAASADQPHWFLPSPAHHIGNSCVPGAIKHTSGFLGKAMTGDGQTPSNAVAKLGTPSPAHSVLPAFLTPEMMSLRGGGMYPQSIPALPPGFPFPPGSGTWGGHVIAQGF